MEHVPLRRLPLLPKHSLHFPPFLEGSQITRSEPVPGFDVARPGREDLGQDLKRLLAQLRELIEQSVATTEVLDVVRPGVGMLLLDLAQPALITESGGDDDAGRNAPVDPLS